MGLTKIQTKVLELKIRIIHALETNYRIFLVYKNLQDKEQRNKHQIWSYLIILKVSIIVPQIEIKQTLK